jgi:hypothetical protein
MADTAIHVTKTVYTVSDFLDWQRTGALDLRPYFQRGSVWRPKAKSFLIDTLLRGFPIPIIYIQTKTDPKTKRSIRRVVDGQQRLRTILAYIDKESLKDRNESDDFTLMRVHNARLAGTEYEALAPELQDRIMQTELSVHVLPDSVTDKTLLEIFARLNSTGVRLNDQELRNANFHGEFKSLVYELSYDQIDRWTDWGTFNPQGLAQMKEIELLSDVVLMLLEGPGGRSKPRLDTLYEVNDDKFPESQQVARIIPKLFNDVDEIARETGARQFLKPSWLYTLFSLVALARYGAPLRGSTEAPALWSALPNSLPAIERLVSSGGRALESGNLPEDLATVLRGASTDTRSREVRLKFLADQPVA